LLQRKLTPAVPPRGLLVGTEVTIDQTIDQMTAFDQIRASLAKFVIRTTHAVRPYLTYLAFAYLQPIK
jgi:hypothetical protein